MGRKLDFVIETIQGKRLLLIGPVVLLSTLRAGDWVCKHVDPYVVGGKRPKGGPIKGIRVNRDVLTMLGFVPSTEIEGMYHVWPSGFGVRFIDGEWSANGEPVEFVHQVQHLATDFHGVQLGNDGFGEIGRMKPPEEPVEEVAKPARVKRPPKVTIARIKPVFERMLVALKAVHFGDIDPYVHGGHPQILEAIKGAEGLKL